MTEDQTEWPDRNLVDRINSNIQRVYPAIVTEMDRRAVEDDDVEPLSELCALAKTLRYHEPNDEIVVEHQSYDVETEEVSEPQVVATGVIGFMLLAQQFADHVMTEHSAYGRYLDDALGVPEVERLLNETVALKEEANKLIPRGVG